MNSSRSESEADVMILEYGFGIVKRNCPEQSGGWSAGIGGAKESGGSPFTPASSL